jgi:DNA repair photolyase
MLRLAKGNMYDFITHTWNPIKGACPHNCAYCYMKRWGKQTPAHLDERELRTNIGGCGHGYFIFAGSSCDIFASDIPDEWIKKVFQFIRRYPFAQFLLQSKNPARMLDSLAPADTNIVLCTTLETNRVYKLFMGNTPSIKERADVFLKMRKSLPLFVTIEPIMDFDLDEFTELIRMLPVVQVNIGADSGNNHLPEPPKEKILEFISELKMFTKVVEKRNLRRLTA